MSMSAWVVFINGFWWDWDIQSDYYKSSHDSLLVLMFDLASFCDNQYTRRLQLRPFGSVKF